MAGSCSQQFLDLQLVLKSCDEAVPAKVEYELYRTPLNNNYIPAKSEMAQTFFANSTDTLGERWANRGDGGRLFLIKRICSDLVFPGIAAWNPYFSCKL